MDCPPFGEPTGPIGRPTQRRSPGVGRRPPDLLLYSAQRPGGSLSQRLRPCVRRARSAAVGRQAGNHLQTGAQRRGDGRQERHETHRASLRAGGCLRPEETITYGRRFPRGPTYEGVYIDDHFVLSIVPLSQLTAAFGPDRELIQRSHASYDRDGFERAPEKGFGFSKPVGDGCPEMAASRFTVIGTEVISSLGTAAAPVEKRGQLLSLTAELVAYPRVDERILHRAVSLFTHPLMHRRELMGIFGSIFRWNLSIEGQPPTRWNARARQELGVAALFLPLAQAHLRWPLSRRVSTTDATPTHGGATEAFISDYLVRELYRFCEHRGCYVRLDRDVVAPTDLLPPFADIVTLCRGMSWRVSRQHAYREVHHINLQETGESCLEAACLANASLLPARALNGTDSTVGLGSWAKGRSASRNLNGVLQRAMAWQVVGRKVVSQFRLPTEDNPSDDPSRLAPLRARVLDEDWVRGLVEPDEPDAACPLPLPDGLQPAPAWEPGPWVPLPWELRGIMEIAGRHPWLSQVLVDHGVVPSEPLWWRRPGERVHPTFAFSDVNDFSRVAAELRARFYRALVFSFPPWLPPIGPLTAVDQWHCRAVFQLARLASDTGCYWMIVGDDASLGWHLTDCA